ncbi:methyltransferase FkbM family [Nitrosococcus halophilus Nc 4]|uniref:Methyltransferase FkbM family n=2 Tax=Nitrosococcus halophilus TaxID=133539 RepID=D5BVE8_NITHN|nr:methyltransferase FkbM family [Nitrosococcus halophilus Nc 4]
MLLLGEYEMALTTLDRETPDANTAVDSSGVVTISVGEDRYRISLPNAETDYIQKRISTEKKPYELQMLEDMRQRLEKGDLVLDVGAHVGNHTLYLAAVVGCKVIAFEPNQSLAGALLSSIEINGLVDSVSVRVVGLGKANTQGHFLKEMPDNLGGQSIELGSGNIQIIPLDSVPVEMPVKALKIDVEGMELLVLQGGETLLRKDRPLLYVECQTENSFRAVANWLDTLDYGYWDTFNATPTHLFLPNEAVDLQHRISRLQFKQVLDTYQAEQKLVALRKKLEDANHKYRDANERMALIKGELRAKASELESVKGMLTQANEKYREVTGQQVPLLKQKLSQLQSELDQATQALHQEQTQRKEEVTHYRGELAAKARELEAVEGMLTQANEKYLEVTGRQVPLLKQKLSQLQSELDQATQALHQEQTQRKEEVTHYRGELAAKASELEAVKRRLTQADEKYCEADDQIPLLKQKLSAATELNRQQQRDFLRLSRQVNDLRLQKEKLESRLTALNNTVSFQLGSSLVSAVRSWQGLARLPVSLWRVGRQGIKFLRAQRQRKRNNRPSGSGGLATPAKKLEKLPVRSTRQHAVDRFEPSRTIPSLTEVQQLNKAKPLKIASIMDDFTFNSFNPECELHQLTPAHWQAELVACQPELLFIESAWRGKDKLWGSKVGHKSEEVQGIVAWCREHHIPTVFWNKEDPVHFETFLNTAKLFDFVFTTDIDCIHRYKAALGHERVYLLPFACQPAIHNPIETYERKDAFCFAGAYYARYPERTRDLESFIVELPDFRPVEIYDRNYGMNDPRYQFPAAYQPYIVGTLPFEEIDKAYKGYRYAINLNSIKQSQTMFARRVFELLACNTLTVSNFSRGLRLLFNDLIITTDSGGEMVRRLHQLADDRTHRDRLCLAELRKVMLEHTYGERMAYVLSKVTGRRITDPLPGVTVIAPANSPDDVERLLAHFQRQQGVESSLTLVLGSTLERARVETMLPGSDERIRLLDEAALEGKTLADLAQGADWITGMLPQDYYGPHYLLDMVLATRYSQAAVIGKAAYHGLHDGQITLNQAEQAYRPAKVLKARSAALSVEAAGQIKAQDWLAGLEQWEYTLPNQLAIDAFNYCQEGGAEQHASTVTRTVDDLPLNTGIPIQQLLARAEAIAPLADQEADAPVLEAQQLAEHFGKQHVHGIKTELDEQGWKITSTLADGKHEYLYAPIDFIPSELSAGANKDELRFYLEMAPGLNLGLVMLFLDTEKQRISYVINPPNRNHVVDIPQETAYIRLGLRVYAGGTAYLKQLLLGHRDLEPAELLGRSDILLLTNHYPRYDDLYRNGFVHSRVRAYQEHGVPVDVFRLRKGETISYHEFQNVDVTTGSQEALHRLLATGRYKQVLVHFLDHDMWEVLQDYVERIKIIVWVHGAEIHPWYRRKFNLETDEQMERAKLQSEKRMAFWKEILNPMPANLRLVFVSRHFAEEVMEDLGFRLPESQYQIIHNPINTELFTYQEKDPEQRNKILSIRPYASKQYANELSVAAILTLAKKPFFDELEFRLIGDGKLFEETLAPLQDMKNVVVERCFLTQLEIAQLHKEYGLFLCPTRWDSQGVSRDEAMSSGLVPVTNRIAAIPEFVDDDCGILAAPEIAEEIAAGIEALINNPERFTAMSRNSAERVRAQTAQDKIIHQELELIRSDVVRILE